jgi:hypothetical protein
MALALMPSVAFGQSKPDLSGRWQSADQYAPITVQQDDRRFVVSTRDEDGRVQELGYELDGSESTNWVTTATGSVWTQASRAVWVNAALAITTATRTDTGAQWEWMQVYLLDPAGHLSITTIDGVTTDARVMTASTIRYDKAQATR